MNSHPYANVSARAHWRRSISSVPYAEVDPVSTPRFIIGRDDKVATAGSCFAQHIARHLKASGFFYYVAEEAHPIFSPYLAEKFNFGLFSARYGNIYTSRQLVQLFERAHGLFMPEEEVWLEPDGSYVDPFRPTCNPGGFTSLRELLGDREQHLSAVQAMFRNLDVFVFTLGLTECWRARSDGATYPVCPGTAGGTFDPAKYEFINLTVEEVISDLRKFLCYLAEVNPTARVVLTVSPVPLVATAEDRHVLASTTLSKSILRVAADVISREHINVAYFESYEIITGNFNRGRYFAEDLRSVTEEGVNHVMRLFLKHYAGVDSSQSKPAAAPGQAQDRFIADMRQAMAVICDEEALDHCQ
jgi:hypothetical protein